MMPPKGAVLHGGWRKMLPRNVTTRLAVLLPLALFVLSSIALARWNIVRPIRALMSGAQAVGGWDVSQRIEVRRQDEIGASEAVLPVSDGKVAVHGD